MERKAKEKLVLTNAYVFGNGMVMAFDQHGQQMSKYQGKIDKVRSLIEKDFPNVKIEGAVWP